MDVAGEPGSIDVQERVLASAAPPAAATSVPESQPRPLSLRAQLTIWFGISFGVILATIVLAIVVVDGGRVFDRGNREDYDWIIRLVQLAFLTTLVGGVAAAWVIVGAALEPLRRITEAARGVAPESIDENRIEMPEVGAEVNEARRELNFALDRIEAGYQAQERFISNVSHELKTPIAVVSTEAQRLLRMERSPDELRKFVDETASQMGHLGKMVESFLTLARIDYESRLQKNEEFWFHDLLIEAVSRSRAQALTHDVHIDLELPEDFDFFDEPTWGDPELVSAAVENLIRNAIRFSPRSTLVHVSLEAEAPADPEQSAADADPDGTIDLGATQRRAVILVRDEGPGMPDDLIATVFEPFQQAEAERGRGRGTGLGLAIAQKVTRLHRGAIRAFNRVDGKSGCVVEIRLPFLEADDWTADREVTADLPDGGLGSGVRKPTGS